LIAAAAPFCFVFLVSSGLFIVVAACLPAYLPACLPPASFLFKLTFCLLLS